MPTRGLPQKPELSCPVNRRASIVRVELAVQGALVGFHVPVDPVWASVTAQINAWLTSTIG